MMADKNIKAWVGADGALMLSDSVEGVTQLLTDIDSIRYYGGVYFVCEAMRTQAGREISKAMGWEFLEEEK